MLLNDLKPLIRQFWIFGLGCALLLAAFFGVRERINYSPMYEASASFTVKVVNPLYAGSNGYNAETVIQMEKTFPYILSSNALHEHVKESLGITYLPSVKASAIDGTNVFTLRVRDSDPQRAYDVLNAVIECYPEVAEFVLGPTKMVLLDESGVPAHPINSYSVVTAAVKGAILALAAWLGILLVIALSRNTIRNEDELKQLLNCTCLGTVPAMKVVGKNTSCPMVTQEHGAKRFADSMRLLQLHMETEMDKSKHKSQHHPETAAAEKKSRVLLISSAVPSEGKTTVAANLAITLAQTGKNVLLMDCDLRNPSVGKAFHIRNERGILEYMDGTVDMKELIKKTKISNLFLITAGKTRRKDVADQVADERITAMIGAMRKVFDYIILDTAPCGLLADAAEVAKAADYAMLVVRQDHASRSQVLDGARFLTDSKLPLIGAVLNGAKQDGDEHYGYGYGYGYGYSYGHRRRK